MKTPLNINIRIFNQRHSFYELWKLRKPMVKALIRFKKIINFLSVIMNIYFKKSKARGTPVVMMIEVSSNCNFECPMCPKQLINIKREEGLLSFELFNKLLREIGDKLMFLAMWNYGEPLLNPDLFKMIRLAKEYNIITGIATNGSLLDEDNIYSLLGSKLDYLIVSVDGANKNTYEKYRRGGDFIEVVNNVRRLIEARRRMMSSIPFVNLQCLLLRDTAGEIADFVKLGKELKVDKVSFKKVHYRHLMEKSFLPEEKRYLLEGKNYTNLCSRPFLGAVILSDGNVSLCCNAFMSQYIIGNIKNNQFLSLWNNKRIILYRDRILNSLHSIDICGKCYSNSFRDNFCDTHH